jgi:hypothetical protein
LARRAIGLGSSKIRFGHLSPPQPAFYSHIVTAITPTYRRSPAAGDCPKGQRHSVWPVDMMVL